MKSSPSSAATSLLALGVLVLVAATAAYAQNVGTVRGTVRSPDGDALPGVLVQVTGDVVRGERTSMTGATGEWLIPGLPPGAVTVTATLEGLDTETVEGVRVSISGVASVNLTMRPERLEEAITVTSEAPVLDVTSSSASVSYSEDLIDAKPTTQRNFQELALMAPGMSMPGRLGNVGAYAGHPTAYGRDQASVAWNVDGLDSSFPDSGNLFGGWTDPDTIAEVQVLGVGAPAEYGNMTAAAVNVVTKSGTNTFHGRFSYTGEFENTTSTGPRTENAAGEEQGFMRDTFENNSLWAGGPLKRDKLFFFAAATTKEDLLVEPGEIAEFIRSDKATHTSLKLDWSINDSNTLTAHGRLEDLEIHKGGSGLLKTNPGAFGREFEEVPYWRIGFQSVVGANTVVEANFSDIINKDRSVSATGSLEPPLIDYTTPIPTHSGGPTYPFLYPVWWQRGHAKVTHFADDLNGSHEFKFGFQYSNTGEQAGAVYPGFGGKYYYKFGANYYIYSRAAHYYGGDTEAIGFYVDDSWRISDRLTLHLGVRTDQDKGEIPSEPILESYLCSELNCGVTTGEFTPHYPDVIDYSSVDPRLGLAYQVGEGDRQGVLRASIGRYHEMNVVSMWNQPHPNRPPAHFGSSPNRNGPFTYFRTVDNDDFDLPVKGMKRPQTDQFALGYEQQLGEYALGAQLVVTDTTDLIGWQIQGDGEYEDVPYVNPLTGETIMLKNLVTQPTLRKANDPGAAANVPPGTKFEQEYTGVFLTFRKRHTGRWSLDSSLGWSESKGVQPRPLQQNGNVAFYTSSEGRDPNHHLYQGGFSQGDRPWVFRAQGMFDLPWQLKAVGALNYEQGRPWRHSARVRLDQGVVQVPLEPYTGDRRMPDKTFIDLALSRQFPLGDRVKLGVDLQVMNLLDEEGFYYWSNASLGRYPTEPVPSLYFLPRRMALRISLRF